jgi:hypothetical protein
MNSWVAKRIKSFSLLPNWLLPKRRSLQNEVFFSFACLVNETFVVVVATVLPVSEKSQC